MPQALIIYASLTGNTEACADILAEALEEHGVEVTLHDVMQAEAADFEDYDCCIAGAYTYGVDGVLPDEMLDFSEDLGQLDLSGKVFGVFGSMKSSVGQLIPWKNNSRKQELAKLALASRLTSTRKMRP